MTRIATFALLFLVAGGLRLSGLDWDQGHHLHPDERFLTMVASAMDPPSSVAEYLDRRRSPLNPSNHGYSFFVYGTLPLFLVHGVAEGLGLADYAHVHLVGRAISALFDLGTLGLVAWIAGTWFGVRAALCAAVLYAFAVSPIQQSHFFTADPPATFFATAVLGLGLRVAAGGSLTSHLAFGLAFGGLLACRVNLALLAPLYALAGVVAASAGLGVFAGRGRGGRALFGSLARVFAYGVAGALVAAVTFRILQPYAFTGPGFLDVALADDFTSSLRTVRDLVTGRADYPPSVQWIGRTPVLFPTRNLLVWGLGPAFGMAALGALVIALVRPGRIAGSPGGARALRGVALFALLPFAYHAVQFVSTGRYFLPLVPAIAIATGAFLAARRSRTGRIVAAAILTATALWAFAFTAIYRRPHSRVAASRWIYENVPPDSFIATEHWDDALPLPLEGKTWQLYRHGELELYAEDTPDKREALIARLDDADVIVLSSDRLYRSIPRTPWRYPLGRRYYELLFSGELGFRLAAVVTSYPRLGSVEIPDDHAEEAFTVYDHPKVLIFEKQESFSRERVDRLLRAVALDDVVRLPPREAGRLYRRWQPTEVVLPGEREVRRAVAVGTVGSAQALVRWLGGLALLTGSAFLLLYPVLRRLPDGGLGIAHVVGWLFPGFLGWVVGSLGFRANAPGLLFAGAALLLAGGAACAFRRRRELAASLAASGRELAVVESVFVGGFALFASLRAFNPAIFWGEKAMDFAILNATLRSRSMPPADPWWAGDSLNYYYYGHQLVAGFATLVDVPPAFAFNLAIATIAALATLAAYLAGRRFGGVAGGLAAAALTTLIGNFEGVRLWLAEPGRAFDFHYFWATTRLWESSINEFPLWNLVFADLHSHVLAQPLSLAALALGTLWIADANGTRPVARPWLFALVAWVGGAVTVTSSWSAPVFFAVQLAMLLADATRARRPLGALSGALLIWAALVAGAWVLYGFYWSSYRVPPLAWGFESQAAPLGAVLRYFGVAWVVAVPALALVAFAGVRARRAALAIAAAAALVAALALARSPACATFAAVAALALAAFARSSEPSLRGAAALVFVAASVGAGTEVVTVADRMNTVFKFYLEAWLLFAVASGALLVRTLRTLRGVARIAYAVASACAVGAGLFTAVTAAYGSVTDRHAASRVPTLDGWAYLERSKTHELDAYRWLGREVAGVPVTLEAQGPSYREYSRVSMNTGLPTVLGWEWHLIQQGRPRDLVEQRKADVEAIYATTDVEEADRLLRRYGVDLVVVGAVERATYPAAGLAKFGAMESLDLVFRNPEVSIYARPGAIDGTRTWIRPVKMDADAWQPPVGRMREPRDAARAPDGSIVVADFGTRRIQRFTGDLEPIEAFGREGGAAGELRDPCGIAVADDGRIFVADTWNHRIQIFAADGEPLAQWSAALYSPRGIALADDGEVFVTDSGNRAVVRFSPEGEVLGRFGADRLEVPIGIAVSEGEVFVADRERREIVVFDASGNLLRSWRVDGWSPVPILEPYLEVSPDGIVWVTDPSARRVLLYDRAGRLLGLARPEQRLTLPLGIAWTGPGRAVVVDAGSDRLVPVYRAPRGRPEPAADATSATSNTVVAPERKTTGKRSSREENLSRPAAE